jgi:hypothetical protein
LALSLHLLRPLRPLFLVEGEPDHTFGYLRGRIDGLTLQTWRLRSRLRARKYAAGFLQVYGLGAPLLEQHGESWVVFSLLASISESVD